MQVIADFHLHSPHSRATSPSMTLEDISKNAKLKGLHLMGTGDFTHPAWFQNLEQKLKGKETEKGSGIFQLDGMNWMLTGEVCTIYTHEKKSRRIHHVLHVPSFDAASQLSEALSKFGRLASDGRPILSGLSSPALVEMCAQISKDILVYPAHAWTSWFGVIGEQSGFNSLEECYQDQIRNIHALETGMSSDPLMNWRVPSLDNFTLLSNSDSHSPWIWRIGREANVFELDRLTYSEINDAIVQKDPKRLKYTIETPPEYGKYHYSGHSACKVSFSPQEAKALGNICPVCHKKLTIGVAQRVEELAERPEGYVPKDAIPFKSLLPLYEILSFSQGVKQLYNKKIIEQQDVLLANFKDELNILMNVDNEELLKHVSEEVTNSILNVRASNVKYVPGYDGEYGVPVFNK
jgi:uncharacterized protein (TIGR00375 family)